MPESETKESSLLFNLRELMSFEDERIAEEEAEEQSVRWKRRVWRKRPRRSAYAMPQRKPRFAPKKRRALAQERAEQENLARIEREKKEQELRLHQEAQAKAHALEQQRLMHHQQEVAAIEAGAQKGRASRR